MRSRRGDEKMGGIGREERGGGGGGGVRGLTLELRRASRRDGDYWDRWRNCLPSW